MARLEDWSYLIDPTDGYTAPELWVSRFHGKVFDHPNCPDGTYVTTSRVISKTGNLVETRNTVYTLGKPSEKQEKIQNEKQY